MRLLRSMRSLSNQLVFAGIAHNFPLSGKLLHTTLYVKPCIGEVMRKPAAKRFGSIRFPDFEHSSLRPL